MTWALKDQLRNNWRKLRPEKHYMDDCSGAPDCKAANLTVSHCSLYSSFGRLSSRTSVSALQTAVMELLMNVET